MLTDAREAPPRSTLEADVCIVGGGAAGITLARSLRGSGLSTVLLEGGGLHLEPDVQALYEGDVAGHPYFPLTACRLRMFGGTTNHWAGYCRPLEPVDFEQRPWIPHSGWPFGHRELAPYYPAAAALCEIHPARWQASFWAEASGRNTLGLREDVFRSGVYQRSRPTRFGEGYRQDLVESPEIRVLLHANATEILTNGAGDAVQRVRARTLAGETWWVESRAFVLACGGIENARLMLVSRSPAHPQGIGNGRDLVGRFFMDHPHLVDGRFLPSDPHLDASFYTTQETAVGRFDGMLALREEVLRSERVQGFAITFDPMDRQPAEVLEAENSRGMVSLKLLASYLRNGRLPEDLPSHLGRVLADVDDVAVAGWARVTDPRREGTMYRVFLRSEQAPNPESRVLLGGGTDALGMPRVRLRWHLGESDLRTVQRAHELLAREVGRAGLGRVYFPDDPVDRSWTKRLFGGNHHMGTTRMHRLPEEGVVDAQCRVHDVANLYLAGSSVFPTCGYANPTLTLVALALRLGDHLRQELA